ncbi:MAG: hypothetical protein ACJAZ3_001060 [Sphingobacteriales bacterium]
MSTILVLGSCKKEIAQNPPDLPTASSFEIDFAEFPDETNKTQNDSLYWRYSYLTATVCNVDY